MAGPSPVSLIAGGFTQPRQYAFADVASTASRQTSVPASSACGSLVVVALYLIAQMVGAGKLIIELLFGLQYHVAVVLVGILMVLLYVLFGGMLATTWVQIIKAVMLLSVPPSWPSW